VVAGFRKSGSFVRFYVEGRVAAPDSDEFLAALAEHRFRTIENAASEETSVGWVCPSDPSGQAFVREAIWLPPLARLRLRADRKKLPRPWLVIRMAQAIAERGGKVGAKERKQIRGEIEDELLPRVLPGVRLVDLVYDPDRRQLLLFAAGNAMAVECVKVFERTFGARLVAAVPLHVAQRSEPGTAERRRLAELEPFSLTRPGEPRSATALPARPPRRIEATQEATA
jgi:DNA recombination-dependent growth factor C